MKLRLEVKPSTQTLAALMERNIYNVQFKKSHNGIRWTSAVWNWHQIPSNTNFVIHLPPFWPYPLLPFCPSSSISIFPEKKDGQHLDGGWTHHQPCADGKLQGRVSRSRRIQAHLFEGQNVGSSWHRTTFSSRNEDKIDIIWWGLLWDCYQ